MEKIHISEFTDNQNSYGCYDGYTLHIKMKEMSNLSFRLDNHISLESNSIKLMIESEELGLRMDILFTLIRKITVLSLKESFELTGYEVI